MPSYFRTLDGREHPINRVDSPIECFRCGICCMRHQPRLTAEEVAIMAEQLGLSTDDFLSKYVVITIVGYLLRQTKKGCVFLIWEEEEGRATCSIHPSRPEACRNWVPSLSRPECREGLARLKTKNQIMLASEPYPSQEAINRLYASLK